MAKTKKEEKEENKHDASDRERARSFKDYNLEHLPHAALPFEDQDYTGKHSYTVCVGDAVPSSNLLLNVLVWNNLLSNIVQGW